MKTLVPIKKNGYSKPSLFEFPSVDTWFDNVFKDAGMTSPSINVVESDNSFIIDVASPGFKRTDFNLEIDGDNLMLTAERDYKNEEEKLNYKRKEFSYSSFKRSFSLPKNVNSDEITAKYEDGILKVLIPKSNKASPNKTIQIE